MVFTDIVWMTVIAGGCVYLLYRSLWKKKGECCGCASESCSVRRKKGTGGC